MAAAPTPPIYHERQQLSRCAVHAVNNLLGGPVYSARVRAAGEREGMGGGSGRAPFPLWGGVGAVWLGRELRGVPGRGNWLGGLPSGRLFLSRAADGPAGRVYSLAACLVLFWLLFLLLCCAIAGPVCPPASPVRCLFFPLPPLSLPVFPATPRDCPARATTGL